MKTNILNVKKVRSITEQGFHCDGGNLYLQVSKYGTKSWVFRFKMSGRVRDMGLGSIDTRTLEEARKLARDLRQKVSMGIDPIAEREAKKIADRGRITFEQAAREWHEGQRAKWKRERDYAGLLTSFERYAFRTMGKLPVDSIALSHVESVLKPIWTEKQESASRLRGNIEAVLDWATVRGYRKGDNPARWQGNLEHVFTRTHTVKHQAAMPYRDVPALMAKVRKRETLAAKALEFAILAGGRTQEAISAQWPEFDLDTAIWTIPAGRMKGEVEHIVPLPPCAVAVLRSLPKVSEFVFANDHGKKIGKRIGDNAMLQTLRALGIDQETATVHGFRSSFRDWAAEKSGFPREVIEASLAHKIKDQAERAYCRTNYLDQRRMLMTAWANHCDGAALADNVVKLQRA